MLKRTCLSIYKFYNINTHNTKNLLKHNQMPLRRILFSSSSNMSGANQIVNYEEVVSATTNSSVYIIDVREPKELLESGKIPNSINIPLAEVENALKNYSEDEFKSKFGRSKPNSETSIIFTCRSGKRAGMALNTALKLGYHNLKNYEGSWLDWEKHNN